MGQEMRTQVLGSINSIYSKYLVKIYRFIQLIYSVLFLTLLFSFVVKTSSC